MEREGDGIRTQHRAIQFVYHLSAIVMYFVCSSSVKQNEMWNLCKTADRVRVLLLLPCSVAAAVAAAAAANFRRHLLLLCEVLKTPERH